MISYRKKNHDMPSLPRAVIWPHAKFPLFMTIFLRKRTFRLTVASDLQCKVYTVNNCAIGYIIEIRTFRIKIQAEMTLQKSWDLFDLSTKSQCLQSNKFALISEVWHKFIKNSQNCYKPGAYLTVDEQLFSTKARCRFSHYIPNKPDKFGIKFWLVSYVSSKYVVNGFPYLGKDERRKPSVLIWGICNFEISRAIQRQWEEYNIW